MKFVLAPDSFKESMTAKEVCTAMEKGIKKVLKDAECISVPMADGGEGTMQSLVDATGGSIYSLEVTAPMGDKTIGKYGILGDGKTAIIEMAESSGIDLVKRSERNPLVATTYGVGELIKDALDRNVEKIIIGLGGSATNDGGAGMLQALGVSLKDSEGNELSFGGEALKNLSSIDMSNFDKRVLNTKFEAACDVENPLTGPKGASYVFGPQKGASKEDVEVLDNALRNFADVVRKQLNKEMDDLKGAGAAGGLGGSVAVFLNAELKRGIELVIKYSGLEEKVVGADYVFTGEGSIDFQSKYGKTPVGVALVAKEHNIPVIAVAGRTGEGIEELYEYGITSILGILPSIVSLDEALETGKENIERTIENVTRIIVSSKKN